MTASKLPMLSLHASVQVACEGNGTPEANLMKAGLRLPSGALQWLTSAQHAAIVELLEAMEETRTFESTAWILGDCLLRAQRANGRMHDFQQ